MRLCPAIASVILAILTTLASALDLNSSHAQAQTDCWCQGCGCKGGPGWRGPNRQCVSHRELFKVCGNPPGSPCVHEGAKQVCDSPRRSRDSRPSPQKDD
jgi:hypothetical protein